MWYYLTDELYNQFLLSFNLLKNNDIKKVKKIIYYLVNNINNNYISFEIPKRNGKMRCIHEPSYLLKNIQRNILNNVLVDMKVSKYAKAYQKKVSLIDNALPHINKKIVLKLDIKDFFDNINFYLVYTKCFREELYPKKMGVLLTNLCMLNNELPQGAPTSAFISNIVLRDFDEYIGKYCDNLNISYTRYSDDLTFSGDFDVTELIKLIKSELAKYRFKLNYDKIRIIHHSKRQIVTGIVVNEKLSVKKLYKKKIRQEIYYIKKWGIDNHLKKIKCVDKNNYLNKLTGRINYVLQIENNNQEFKNYLEFLRQVS